MRHSLLLTVACLWSLSLLAADSLNQSWQRAGHFYQQKQYDSAAYYYERIAAGKPADAAVYYNLGNTYYRLNEIGPSVLNYERALKRAPSYKDASDNLLLAQSRIPNRIPGSHDIFFVRWWQALTRPDRAGFWAIVSLVLFLAGIGLLLYRRFNRNSNLIHGRLIGGIALIWITSLFLSWQSSRAAVIQSKAVVLRNEAPLMNTPAPAGKPVSLIPEGTTVALEGHSGRWLRITLPDGRAGWMQEDDLHEVD